MKWYEKAAALTLALAMLAAPGFADGEIEETPVAEAAAEELPEEEKSSEEELPAEELLEEMPAEETPVEETPQETEKTKPAEDSEAWYWDGDTLTDGALWDILPLSPGNAVIYIRGEENQVFCAPDVTEETLGKRTFLPDPDVYGKDGYEAVVSFEAPEGVTSPEAGRDFVYVYVKAKETPAPQEGELSVTAEDYADGEWSNLPARFALEGIPEGAEGYGYAAIVYGERFVPLSWNVYEATEEGEYEVRFAILDPIGDVAALSEKYLLKLDFTAPETIYPTMEDGSKTRYVVYAEDRLSGATAISADGGETWFEPDENGLCAFEGKKGECIAAGQICAMDAAGNIAVYETDFQLPQSSPGYYNGGGGGGGGGESGPVHAPAGQKVELNAYNAVELTVEDMPMSVLTLGGQELPLKAELVGENLPEGAEARFTAEVTSWGCVPGSRLPEEGTDAAKAVQRILARSEAGETKADTLLLRLQDDPALPDQAEYRFDMNGVLFRVLQNSGIDYLAICFGDECVALPTAGFTAGTEYARLKAAGVSTKKMDYALYLNCDRTGARDMELTLDMTVNDGEEETLYSLTDDETQEMYYYDVQIGTADMMDVIFGTWEAAE